MKLIILFFSSYLDEIESKPVKMSEMLLLFLLSDVSFCLSHDEVLGPSKKKSKITSFEIVNLQEKNSYIYNNKKA